MDNECGRSFPEEGEMGHELNRTVGNGFSFLPVLRGE